MKIKFEAEVDFGIVRWVTDIMTRVQAELTRFELRREAEVRRQREDAARREGVAAEQSN